MTLADPGTVLITGAAGGIGGALARRYARSGRTLGLHARSGERLQTITTECRAHGATVDEIIADIRDGEATAAAIAAFDNRHPVDLAILNAGISPVTDPRADLDGVRDVVATNSEGTLNVLLPLIERMRARRRGQIAIMGSLGARSQISASPAYSMSKAALETYGLALRETLAGAGIHVSVISPGFVRSAMSDRVEGPKPYLIEADTAASQIVRGLARDKARIAFPRTPALAAWLSAVLPPDLARRLEKPFNFRLRG